MAGVSASRRAAQLDMAKSDGPRARTADDVRPAARLGRVLVEHGVDGRLRLVARLAEHADSPARAAARDLRAVEARARRRRGDELDDAVCGGGAEPDARVRLVRPAHELAEPEALLLGGRPAQQRLELADARVLEDGMGGAGGDGILRLRPDGGGCVAVAGGVLLQEGAAGEGGRQRRQGGELFGRQLRQVGQHPPLAEGGLQQGAAHEGGGADGAVVGAADRVAHLAREAPRDESSEESSLPPAPPAGWRRAAESMPHTRRWGGMGTVPRTVAGRQRRERRRPSRPSAQASWSMIPHGAPTTSFSTFWQRRASFSSGERGGLPRAASRALMLATSTAAEEETPAASGTSEATRMARPPSAGETAPSW
mmetsp:Transcript_854/g.2837  ORF Transcript_854/g.2837 Transcript_854/m.2837 type:complete len:368 (-) Transcript_854:499-1602(-)